MASTSKYIQIDPQILVEYIYTDTTSPEVIQTSTTGNRLLLLNNIYTGTNFLFNEDNPEIVTGNLRNKSSIPIDESRTKYAYLTNKNALNYLDFDTELVSENDLLSDLTGQLNVPVRNIQYDTIRLHLVSGFSFEDKGDGFIFEVLFKDRNRNKHNLLSITYRHLDSYEINNPAPFISNEKLYTNYIELKIPALNYLINDYIINSNNNNSISNLISGNNGINVQETINLSLKFINSSENINGQTYYNTGTGKEVSLSKLDEYSGLSAVIQESTSGDFFEIYGQFNGEIYQNFILNLNNMPNTDIVVVHDIIVLEQIGGNFTKTSEQSFIQTDSFDNPYRFRPIILNSHIATSYRINYTLRILNKIDNSQIIRNSQYSSFNVKKYGRKIRKINLGTVPTITNVYNKITSNLDNVILNNKYDFNIENSPVKQTEFVMGFKESINISASIGTVTTKPSVLEEGDIVPTEEGVGTGLGEGSLEINDISGTNKIFGQSEGIISITPFDNFIKFVFYNNSRTDNDSSTEPELLDLTNIGTLFMSFKNDSGDEVRIENYRNIKNISPVQGEAVFRISKEQSRKILSYTNNTFYISSKLIINDNRSDETMLYSGKWFKANEKQDIILTEVIKDLENKLEKANNLIELEKEESDTIINELENEISILKKEKKILEDRISELDLDLNDLISDVRRQERNAVKEKERNIKERQTIKASNIRLIKDKIDKGLGKFVSPKSFNNLKALSAKNFKINK